ncbi:MAG: sulfite exporter TauE/SafE family protein [Novosphingobium sp.]
MIAGFTLLQIGVAITAALAAAFVRGLAGFGMAILLVPVLGLAIPPAEAVVVGNWLGLMIGLKDVKRNLADAERSARTIALLAVLATPLGVLVLSQTAPALARLVIALVALAAFAIFLLPQREAHAPGRVTTGLTGIVSGLLTGFAGMPGPPVVPYYLGRKIAPRIARASMMLIFMATSIAGVLSASALGVATVREPVLALLLFPAVLLGDHWGHRAFGKVSPTVWRSFIGVVLGAAAAGALIKLLNA